jgi:nitroreductase
VNDTIELLLRHRSIRAFTDAEVPEAHIHLAVQAGQAASTSSAVQAYSLVQVTRPEERRALVPLTGGQEKVATAPAFFVVCGDARRHRLICARAGAPYDARLEGFLLAVVDATLFAQNLVIAFESMGYGACYVGGLRNQLAEVDAILEFPAGVYPLYGLCVGIPAEAPIPRPRLPVSAVFSTDRVPEEVDVLADVDRYDEGYRAYMRERLGKDRAWSPSMARKFSEPRRVEVAAFFREKGADLT